MLKKITLVILFSTISFNSAYALPKTALLVAPYQGDQWGYIYSVVKMNDQQKYEIKQGATIPVNVGDKITLNVVAMNASPRLDQSCQNLQIQSEGVHAMLFELEKDRLVHCQYK